MSARRLLLGGAAAALLLGLALPASSDEPLIHDSDKLNYRLSIKPTWQWKTPDGKHGVVEVAERALEQIGERQPDGKLAMVDGNGRGGRLALSISDPPKDLVDGYEESVRLWQVAQLTLADLEARSPTEAIQKQIDEQEAVAKKHEEAWTAGLQALAANRDVLNLLMLRFGTDASKWPEPSVDTMTMGATTDRDPGIPAVHVKVEGEAGNLKGVKMPCVGNMWVLVVKGKMHRLVGWAWTTRRDVEGVKADIDYAQLSYVVPKSAAAMARPDAAAPTPGAPLEDLGDTAEEKPVENRLFSGWEVRKPVGFKTVEIDRTKPDAPEFRFQAGTGRDPRVTVDLDVQRSDEKGATGSPKGEMDIRRLYVNRWVSFLSTHSQGALEVFEWQRPNSSRPYFSLPDLEKRIPVKRPPPGVKKEWDWAEIEKLGVAAEADGVRIGELKGRNTYRYGSKGERERGGTEFLLHYAFHNGVRTYVITVSAYGDSLLKFAKETDLLLRSFTVHPVK